MSAKRLAELDRDPEEIRRIVSIWVGLRVQTSRCLRPEALARKVQIAAREAQERENQSRDCEVSVRNIDAFVVATRDLHMPDKQRHQWARFIDEWRGDHRKAHGVYGDWEKRRFRALQAWQMAKMCRRLGIRHTSHLLGFKDVKPERAGKRSTRSSTVSTGAPS
jgi:hypothetical protein